jgi:hypothetical protein
MLGGIILDRVDYTADVGVMMDNRISFSMHIDVTVGKALEMLEFLKKLSEVFGDPLCVASCIWRLYIL